MAADWKKAKQMAVKLRSKYKITDPPVNLFDIAANEGIEIIYFRPAPDTKDVSGILDKEHKQVFLNIEESPGRQNFTLAHELAHYFLDHSPNEYGVYRRDSLYAPEKPDKEQEADYFAAELLMPKALIDKAISKYSLSTQDSQVLSKLFGVSPSAMRYRLKSLGHEQAAG